jgi:integrase
VGWIDPDGKRKSKRIGAKSNAEKQARRIEGQLASGTYQNNTRGNWTQFKAEYAVKVLAGAKPTSKMATEFALKHFERIVKPQRMAAITTQAVDGFVSSRRLEKKTKGKNAPQISPATVNKELRHLRAVFRKAAKWGYLPKVPDIEFLRERKKIATFLPPEDFAKVYAAAGQAVEPETLPAADWWRGLLMVAYMTGWRIGSLLAMRWADVDLEAGTALSRADDNKGGRDQRIDLHPVVIEHLRKLESFKVHVFDWPGDRRQLYDEWHRLQGLAGILRDDRRFYGFHDLRRAFATMNADRLTADALQLLMQHKDYQTTQRYINIARQMKPAAHNLFVPTVAVVAS